VLLRGGLQAPFLFGADALRRGLKCGALQEGVVAYLTKAGMRGGKRNSVVR
jgi:hypothetical protein